MRRRPSELRRLSRRRLSRWILWIFLIGLLASVVLLLLALQRHSGPPSQDIYTDTAEIQHETLNITQELLSVTSPARQLVDQLSLAKAYVIIAKEHGNLQLAWEFSSQIRRSQRLLSRAAAQGKTVIIEEADPIIRQLSELIYQAQAIHYDISTTITTLKRHIEALEERSIAATVQSFAFGRLTADSMPKNLHCLILKLTEDWYMSSSLENIVEEQKNSPRLVDNNLYHFCIFSDNVLATSVVVNSTVSNTDHPRQLVFHIVTDRVNHQAMTIWFLKNDFRGSMIYVQNIEEFSWLNASYSPWMKQLSNEGTQPYYFGDDIAEQIRKAKFGSPKPTSMLQYLRFYIPDIHPDLEKVVFLEDDVVIQKDLTPLFSLDLHGNVIGAVETCLEAAHRLYKYLNFSNPQISTKFDPQSCGWGFGMNIFDLIAWKKFNLTETYHYWQKQNADQSLWKIGTLPPGLLTFYGLMEPLDRRWHVSGLGFNPEIDDRLIESAAVVHFTGNMKPWLRLAISRYKHLWQKYINLTHPLLQDCNN